MELQSFNASDNMNASGQLSDSMKPFTSSAASHTDVDPANPVYQSMPDAKVAHARYTGEQVRNPGQTYMTPGDLDQTNEYDIINEKQVTGQRSQGSIRLQSSNPIYSDTTSNDYRHASTLEKGKQKYSGGTSGALHDESDIKYGACRVKWSTTFLCFFVSTALLVAVAAFALVVIILLGVVKPECDCEDSKLSKFLEGSVLNTYSVRYCHETQGDLSIVIIYSG